MRLWTKWGKEIDREHVLEEYPRPNLVRENYLNLNGEWEYSITVSRELPENYEGTILVPFSPEAPLSGVNRQVTPQDVLHYRRTVTLSEGFAGKGRCLLHFGAVDQAAAVFWNGTKVGSHEGGYLPFTIDVTKALHPGDNVLQVVVTDPSDTSYHARGKQKLARGGMWYTAQSGIWQTVWIECVPEEYITALRLSCNYDEGELVLKALSSTRTGLPAHAVISLRGKKVGEFSFRTDRAVRFHLGEFESWSPESPTLYDLSIQAGKDRIKSYFAMRKVSVERDKKGILRFFLNNRPYYQNGLLDQGYFPDGLYTPPSDEALVSDILRMKELGFNMLRKHIKVECARWYYHCDRLGMLVWQDMVSGGRQYHMQFVCTMPNMIMKTGRIVKDSHYRLFSRTDPEGRAEYTRELKEMIRVLYNHPSIVAWVPFNEGWGQFDAAKATKLVRSLDRNRLIDEASGWFDQGGGDMYSIHNYWRKLKVTPQKDRVVSLTECGGYSCLFEGHSACDRLYGYRKYATLGELTNGIVGLWETELIPALADGLSASVYTQVSDIEDEVNGLLTYDRECVKVEKERIRRVNRKLRERFERITGG